MNYAKSLFPVTAALSILLAGCAGNPLMQSGAASSTDSAEQIEQALEEAREQAPDDAERTPDEVTDALMPDMDSAQAAEPAEERFNVNARDLPASTFLESLVEGSPYNVVVHPEVSGSISLRLDQVTVPEVMDLVADMYELDVQRNGRIFQVRPGGLQTRVFQIDYLDMVRTGGSETQVRSGQISSSNDGEGGSLVGTSITTETESDFWNSLTRSLEMIVGQEDGRNVVTTPGAGMIVIRATPDELRSVEDYLRRTDLIAKRQVILEAKVMEVVLEEGYQQGIDWGYVDQISSSGPSASIDAGQASRNVGGGDSGGVFSSALQIGDFDTLIQLLGQQGNVQVLSSPRISTVNNEKAVIKVGSDEFFVTDLDFDDRTSTAAETSRSTSVELTPFFSGISLDVTPQISDDDRVTLHVHPSVSEVEDQEKLITIGDRDVTLPLALSTVRETDSVVNARSGQIVVIGGLIQNTSEEQVSAVPFFSDIPVVGELFKQRRFESRKSELVILLRPVIVDDEAWQEDIEGSRQRTRALRELLESPDSPRPQPAQPQQR